MQNCSKCGKCVTLHEKGIKNVRNSTFLTLQHNYRHTKTTMDTLQNISVQISDFLWSYIIITVLICCALFFAWSMADITMALLTLCNLVAIVMLSRQAVFLLQDYRKQKKEGKNPVFKKEMMPEIADKLEAW